MMASFLLVIGLLVTWSGLCSFEAREGTQFALLAAFMTIIGLATMIAAIILSR